MMPSAAATLKVAWISMFLWMSSRSLEAALRPSKKLCASHRRTASASVCIWSRNRIK